MADEATKVRLIGDANRDGEVNFTDYLVLSANFTKTDAIWEDGDFNGDEMVTFEDFLLLAQNFARTSVFATVV